jgi:hypothetical protein
MGITLERRRIVSLPHPSIFFRLLEIALPAILLSSAANVFSASTSSLQAIDTRSLTIPKELGSVSEVISPAGAEPNGKLVILIQDAHTNYEAQKHLAGILDALAAQHGIRLILVEGSEGDMGLTKFRSIGTTASRRAVAEEYLKKGMLSGEEYLDIVSEHPFTIWGIEDTALYDRNFNAFLKAEQVREESAGALAKLRDVSRQLEAIVWSEALRELEAKRGLYDAGELPVTAYAHELADRAAASGLELTGYPNLERFVTATGLEGSVDVAQAGQEQKLLITELRSRVSADELTSLKEIGLQLQNGKATRAAFYRELDRLIRFASIDTAEYPILAQYIRYLLAKDDLDLGGLLVELHQFESALKQRLADTPEARQLLAINQGLFIFDRLILLKLVPHEYQAYREQKDTASIPSWVEFLAAQAAQNGIAWEWDGGAEALQGHLSQAAEFYEAAEARNQTMVQRALDKMDTEGAEAAVLILGGFHTDECAALLANQGFEVAVLTPKIGTATDDARYAEILKYKQAHRMLPVAPGLWQVAAEPERGH